MIRVQQLQSPRLSSNAVYTLARDHGIALQPYRRALQRRRLMTFSKLRPTAEKQREKAI